MRRVETLLRQHIGLDAASIGSALIERIVRLRMKQHGLKKPDAYQDLLATSRHELEQLIEAVVVTETWFFRDREPFHAFTQLAAQDWRARHPVGTLRVLSMPCSSGEEPYSLAMALLDAGLPAATFTIDAIDISANALARAERAVYGKNSFRGPELRFRERHFQPVYSPSAPITPREPSESGVEGAAGHKIEGYALNPLVRRCVNFTRGNILDDNFLAASAPYDFIFCRNLLIYFDSATQTRALGKLHHLLAADGLLFVGPAEMPLAVASGFVNAGLPMAFACHKTTHAAAPPIYSSPAPLSPRERSDKGADHAIIRNPSRLSSVPEPSAAQTLRSQTSAAAKLELETARQHADAGRLAEATALCDAHLLRAGPSAQAYYLLGLVKDAGNDPAAITYYRKALYLEPNHYEALTHITLALEKAGEIDAARIYQRRAERAQPKS